MGKLLGNKVEPDTYFPTDALLYGPNGNVIFYGHVQAQGLDLNAWTQLVGIPESPPVQREIKAVRWSGDTSTDPGGTKPWEGQLLAEIYTEDAGGNGQINLQPYAGTGASGITKPAVYALGNRLIDTDGKSEWAKWTDWAPVTFGGAFTNQSPTSPPTGYHACEWRYWKKGSGQGEVQLRGAVKAIAGFSGGYAILTNLPLVPPSYTNHLVYCASASGGNGAARLQAAPDGNLYYAATVSGAGLGVANDFISLDNISIPISP